MGNPLCKNKSKFLWQHNYTLYCKSSFIKLRTLTKIFKYQRGVGMGELHLQKKKMFTQVFTTQMLYSNFKDCQI